QAIVGRVPVGGEVGQILVIDDDQEIIVAHIALGGVGLVHPAAAGVGSEQDDLEDPAGLLALGGRELQGILELGEQDLDHAGKLALLSLRQMVQILLHTLISPIK